MSEDHEMTLEIFELGSPCMIDGEIPAVITGVNIRPAQGGSVRVSYEVTWWDERSRRCEWVEPSEIKPKEPKSTTLHFTKVPSR